MDFLLTPKELLSHNPSNGFKMFVSFGNCRHDFAKSHEQTGLTVCEEYRQIKIENMETKIVFLESLVLLSIEACYKKRLTCLA